LELRGEEEEEEGKVTVRSTIHPASSKNPFSIEENLNRKFSSKPQPNGKNEK